MDRHAAVAAAREAQTAAHLLGFFPLTGAPCSVCGSESTARDANLPPSVARATFLVVGEGLIWLDVCAEHMAAMRKALAHRGPRGGIRFQLWEPNRSGARVGHSRLIDRRTELGEGCRRC